MSREILFKAKRKNWRELPKEEWWVEGDVIHQPYGVVIQYYTDKKRIKVVIDPETLCQYTWMNDNNFNRIWENDICVIHSRVVNEEDGYFIVKWAEKSAKNILEGIRLVIDFDYFYEYECEAIGNFFDNPELLERDGGT